MQRESECFDLCHQSATCRAVEFFGGKCVLSRMVGRLEPNAEKTIGVKCGWEMPGVPRNAANNYYPHRNDMEQPDYLVTTRTDDIAVWRVDGGQDIDGENYYENLWDANPLTAWKGLAIIGRYGIPVPDSEAFISATFRERILFVEFGLKTHRESIKGDYEEMCLILDENEATKGKVFDD